MNLTQWLKMEACTRSGLPNKERITVHVPCLCETGFRLPGSLLVIKYIIMLSSLKMLLKHALYNQKAAFTSIHKAPIDISDAHISFLHIFLPNTSLFICSSFEKIILFSPRKAVIYMTMP